MNLFRLFNFIGKPDGGSFDCDRVQSLLSLHADGMASSSERVGIDVHLSGCNVCREQYECLRAIREVVAARPVAVPPTDLRLRIAEAIATERRPSRVYSRLLPVYGLAGALLVAAVILSPMWRGSVFVAPGGSSHSIEPVAVLPGSSHATGLTSHSGPRLAEIPGIAPAPLPVFTLKLRSEAPVSRSAAESRPVVSVMRPQDSSAGRSAMVALAPPHKSRSSVTHTNNSGLLLATNVPGSHLSHAAPETPASVAPTTAPAITQVPAPVTMPGPGVQTAQLTPTPATPQPPIRVAAADRSSNPLSGLRLDHLEHFAGTERFSYAMKSSSVGTGTVPMVGSSW